MHPSHDDNRFDVLRLLAAWLVLFSHCFPLGGHPGGEPLMATLGLDTLGGVGVGIFFVLSGYLVTLSLQRSANLAAFARRRALRIYPGLVVICLLCVGVLGPLLTTLAAPAYWRDAATWRYLAGNASAWNIHYALPGVFAGNPHPGAVNGSLWSLPYELTCYGVLVLASLLPGSLRRKVTLLAGGLVAMLLVRPLFAPQGDFVTVLGLDYFHGKLGLLFALGAVVACWRTPIRRVLWPSVLLLVAAAVLPSGVLRLLCYVLGLALLTLWLALYGLWLPRIPARMGDWSYGAYLYGFPVQQVLAHFRWHEASFFGFVLASTVLTAALAALSWHLVEKPALRWK